MPTQEVARAARASALLQRGARRPHPILLDGGGPDSWLTGEVIYADTPVETLTVLPSGWACRRRGAEIRWQWGDPLTHWERFLGAAADDPAHAGGGVATVLSYELRHWVERLPRRHRWPRLPVLWAARYDWSYRAIYRTGAAAITAPDEAVLRDRLRWYAAGDLPAREPPPPPPAPGSPRATLDRRAYTAMIARAQEYIAAGDVYEINLAQPFTAPLTRAHGPALFAAWTEQAPMPFAAYVDGGAWALAANSPECLLATDGTRITTWPIKGTRPRDPGVAPAALAAALQADEKERAEHVMVVDLERNDLGRICEPGSVAVAELAAVRQYPSLVHMVSEVTGRLRPATSPAAVLRALFPGGSITGAPKVRAMQLIEALEPAARGFYTGAIGWTEPSGYTRFNIAIRSAVLDAGGLTWWAGGGIVADSDPDREYDETVLKSETFFRAVAALEGRCA